MDKPYETIVEKPYEVIRENVVWNEKIVDVDERDIGRYKDADVMETV